MPVFAHLMRRRKRKDMNVKILHGIIIMTEISYLFVVPVFAHLMMMMRRMRRNHNGTGGGATSDIIV